jgi:sigma-B regulation protein RsbU (phosphoserine phosphatase)
MSRFVLTGNLAGKPLRYELRPGTYVVGRSSDCQIPLTDNAISRRHAEFVLEKDRLVVRDLGSTNGTFVNGNRLDGETTIGRGDQIRFGHVTLSLAEQETARLAGFAPEGTMVTMTTSVKEIKEETERTRSEGMFVALHEAGQMLSRKMDLEDLYEAMLKLIERFIKPGRILILSRETKADGSPEVLAARLVGSSADEPLRMSHTMLREVLQGGRSFLTSDAATDERFNATESIIRTGVHAAMGAPLFDNDRVLGAIYVDSRVAGLSFKADDLRLLTLLANMLAVKITNSRLEEVERHQERLQQELTLAARIQRNLLPASPEPIPGYDVFTHQTPCYEVGGDLFDVRRRSDGRVWLVLGDVTGKGIGAAMLMATVMASLQILEETCTDPLDLVGRLERHLEQHVEIGTYVTLFAGLLDPESGALHYVNAGQNPPLLLHGGTSQSLDSTGLPVAMLPGMTRTSAETSIPSGANLLIFSDGIPETEKDGVQYEEVRLVPFLKENCQQECRALGTRLLTDVELFRGDQPPSDDLTLVVVRRF